MVSELLRLAESHRLVTVTGPGGSGKTRLVQELAPLLTDRFGGEVCWVDLAPLQSPAGVARAVAGALRVGAQASDDVLADLLSEHLRRHPLAMLVDNCEHVIDGVGELVDRLLSDADDLVVVATSREPLRVAGEVVFRLGPMTDDEAVALFVERARAVVPDLAVDDAQRRVVGDICAALDRMPLAIELAAPWLRFVSAQDLRSGLADRFSLLASETRGVPARQRTLLATVQWSHERLSADERALFRRLAVFSGSFSLAAVDDVCVDESLGAARVVQLLSSLCDRSMVVADPSGGRMSRFHLLETLRQFGWQQLD